MTYPEQPSADADEVRRLATTGELTQRFRDGSRDEQRRLRAGATEIVGPLVYERVTRPVERKRHHYQCAGKMQRLLPDCLERYHNDVDAVVDHLFAHADLPITTLEGWLTSRLLRATVDAHRVRRGQLGAPQKPRVPAWLADVLGRDPWLVDLAKAILEWVGADATAGSALWPLGALAERRAGITGGHTAGEAVVAAEVETVLAAMRRRLPWYEKYVERPLGRKQAQVWYPSNTTADTDPTPLPLVSRHERDESVLRELAGLSIEVMTTRINRGEDATTVVTEVLAEVFGGRPAGHDLENTPTDEGDLDQVADLIDDPVKLKRIVTATLELLGNLDRPSEQ
ncbi:hypothetical protein OHA70_29155 [Kribbella sp. NBC_00382]|uniref:hypothetical protein n=1 Tax=Kribbella sp. NBC_00382 TaxID=2975967 RepID=UPI002E204BE1